MSTSKNKSYKNQFYQPYITTNTNSALNKPIKINGSYKKLPYPKISIYNGAGASHSWLWFVDILDSMGFFDIEFVDEQHIKNGGLKNLQVLLISGGDTFAIAENLGKKGAENIRFFIEEGGTYIGSCAGAYLPLQSSLSPLDLFNFASVKISNLAKTLPQPVRLPEKFCTSYGCQYVFHPVREEVKIKLTDFPSTKQHGELTAPIYGGPAFLPSENARTLACYIGFTNQTLFLTNQQLAHDTMIGKSAVITKKMGKGNLFLLGPHLEHPRYFKANTLIADMIYQGMGENHDNASFFMPSVKTSPCKNILTIWRDIKSQVSNCRIVALSLERERIHWQIGHKLYEPEKISLFLEAIWSRWNKINIKNCGNSKELCAILNMAETLTQLLRTIKRNITLSIDTTNTARETFVLLKKLTASFLSLYFKERILTIRYGGIY